MSLQTAAGSGGNFPDVPVQDPVHKSGFSPLLPADHVLSSGAVLFPGVFDQNGCPLVVFPVEGHVKLSGITKAEVVDFIKYFQSLHSKKQEKQSLVSVVADLRDGSPSTTRFIAETLLLLENKRTVYSVYIIQPKKKEVLKLLLKLLAPSKSHTVSFRKLLLKEVPELYNYIDRSQLPASLGGYLMYCHNSWVFFIKEIHTFLQEFLSVLQRLPSYISELQGLSRLPPPSSFSELQHFCITNKAKFLQLRRELGLDELLRRCETMVDKLRYPEQEPCYQAMAGTALFTHTAFDMLQNHSRITAAVEKVELLWKHAFSKAHLQLQLFQLRNDALQITEKIETHQEKLQLYTTEITKSFGKAEKFLSTFETTIYTPAMELVQRAEHVIHTLKAILPLDAQTKESWALDLDALKENLHSDVHFTLQTLRAVSNYHHHYNKANRWCSLILCENFLQELLSEVHGSPLSTKRQSRNWGNVPAWRQRLSSFLKKNPAPDLEELLHLVHLSSAIPDKEVQQTGRSIFQRCTLLKKLLISSEPVLVEQLQLALQWQYELLRSGHLSQSDNAAHEADVQHGSSDLNQTHCENTQEAVNPSPSSPSPEVSGLVSADWKSPSCSSLNSGIRGTGRSQDEEDISVISDCENNLSQAGLGSVGNSGEASIKILPKVEMESLNVKVKVKHSAAPPNNPWLSLPVDDLENYTVTVSPRPMPQKRDLCNEVVPGLHTIADQANGSSDQNTQVVLSCSEPIEPRSLDWNLYSDGDFSDVELSSTDNILSSTISDGRDESSCSTEGIPTLLWDSYDLHNEKPDAVDSVVNVSLMDWELKEQESLKEVEKILERADGILEEEENVLAQEDELDALVRLEDRRDDWFLWDTDNKLGMSSSELAEAAAVGPEDPLHVREHDGLCELKSVNSARESEACRDEFYAEAAGSTSEGLLQNRLHLMVIDEPQHGSSTGGALGSAPAVVDLSVLNKDREAFRLQLEKEKRELEALEESLYKDDEFKKHMDTTRGAVRCSVKENLRNVVDGPVCAERPSVEEVNPTPAELQTVHSNKVCDLSPSLMAPDPGCSQPAVEDDSLGSLPKNTTPHLSNDFVLNKNAMEYSNNNNNKLLLSDRSYVLSENICDVTKHESDLLVVPDCLETDQQLTEKVLPSAPEICPNEPPEFDPSRTIEVTGVVHKGFQSSEAVRISSGEPQKTQTSPNGDIREIADFNIPIVLDSGSGFIKAGFADQELPNVVFPNIIGVPKYEIMNGNLERDAYVGLEAQQMRGVLALKRPIRNGIIGNWDDMEKIWHHTFQQLLVDPEDHPVLLTEAAMNPLENRQRAVEIMFETFNVPFTYVAMQAVLALYAAGRTSGVVFDSGDGVSHSVPVFEGYCLSHAVQRFPLGGLDVTIQLKKLLQEQGVCMRTTAEEEIVREMKERCCRVALHYEAELSRGGSSCGEVHYTMPDGQIVTLGTERFRAPEILFKPELIGQEHCGMHESIFKSIFGSDIDLRRSLLENVVLSGGNTLLPGLPERLQAELKGLVSADMGASVRVRSPKDRDFLVWSGGTVLASLPTFSSAWISQEEYEEYGPQIVFRKCF